MIDHRLQRSAFEYLLTYLYNFSEPSLVTDPANQSGLAGSGLSVTTAHRSFMLLNKEVQI